MKKLLLASLLAASPAAAQVADIFDPTLLGPSQFMEVRDQMTAPLSKPLDTGTDSWADVVARHIVISTKKGPLLLLPMLDSSKDLGANYGVMPILAIRDDKRQAISSVFAPSISYNRYLHLSITHRHYIFPSDKNMALVRASYSTVVARELFLRYFDPELWGTKYRVNLEARHWVNGKASFYGIGQGTSENDRATFALNLTGEEATVSIPLPNNFYIDFTHSYYRYKTTEGPVPTAPQLSDEYPQVYSVTEKARNMMTHRLQFFYDSTDHPTIPRNGSYASVSVTPGFKGFGSDYSYATYQAEAKHYINAKKTGRSVTALHALFQHMQGNEIPFYGMPVLGEGTGLRSVGDGRFVDRGKVVFNVEQRFTVSRLPVLNFFSEFEISPFLDMGQVFRNVSDIKSTNIQIGYGAGIRIVLRPQVVATADFAIGREGLNTIIRVGYPF